MQLKSARTDFRFFWSGSRGRTLSQQPARPRRKTGNQARRRDDAGAAQPEIGASPRARTRGGVVRHDRQDGSRPGACATESLVRTKAATRKAASDLVSALRWWNRQADALYPGWLAEPRAPAGRERLERKFRKFLREHMKANGLAIAELARRSGIPLNTLEGWLHRGCAPPGAQAKLWSRSLKRLTCRFLPSFSSLVAPWRATLVLPNCPGGMRSFQRSTAVRPRQLESCRGLYRPPF
jgi:hypothetical protein